MGVGLEKEVFLKYNCKINFIKKCLLHFGGQEKEYRQCRNRNSFTRRYKFSSTHVGFLLLKRNPEEIIEEKLRDIFSGLRSGRTIFLNCIPSVYKRSARHSKDFDYNYISLSTHRNWQIFPSPHGFTSM